MPRDADREEQRRRDDAHDAATDETTDDVLPLFRFRPGRRACDTRPGSDTVWRVRTFDPESGFYTVDGCIGGVWPAVRCFTSEELIPL